MRLAVFVSGGGSNFQAILDAAASGRLSARVVLCVSSRPDAGALERARRHGVPTAVLSAPRADEREVAREMLDLLSTHDVDFVALAGFMRRVPPAVVRAFRNRMLNVHPALLPAFGGAGMYGRRVHEAVIASGVSLSGATVHLVDDEYDTGPIVLQNEVPVLEDDTPESLAARVLAVEHRLYPEALDLFARGRIRVKGPRVLVLPDPDS
jgi:phosphoribosylglycinamide formyltransferase-1